MRNRATGVQVLVPNDKAERLIAHGEYEAVPDDEQPAPGIGERHQRTDDRRGHTSIAGAIIAAVDLHLRAAEYGYE